MDLYDLLEQNKVTTKEIDHFSEVLSSKPTLKALCECLSNKVDKKKAFAIAKIFSQSIIGMDLEEYAPNLIDERDKLLKKDALRLVKIKKIKDQVKTLKLIDEDMALYIFEKRMKVTVD